MKTNRSNFAQAMKAEIPMLQRRTLKVMAILGLTLFVSVSAFAPGPILHGTDKQKNLQTLRGGDGSGGADSANDSKGRRRLLDLIEKDELEYFTHLNDPNQEEIRKYLVRLHFDYFGRNVKDANGNTPFSQCPEILYKYWHLTGGNETFVTILLKAYGLENATFKFSLHGFGFCPGISAGMEAKFTFGSSSPNTKTLKWAFTDLPLEDIEDEGAIRISDPDSKRQLAIQSNGLVVINRQEFDSLDNESQSGLFTHEALLYTVSVLNPDLIQQKGTRLIRTYNRRMLKFFGEHDNLIHTRFPITLESVVEAFQALEIPAIKK